MNFFRIAHSLLLVLSMVLLITCGAQSEGQETYRNPVIPGDIPDPTIIRVGDTYYAAGTSCDFAPNYPLYESPDLINWTQIGSVFNDPPQWTSDDFWAPELFYRDGTFYVYYTTKRKSDRIACIGVATTTDIHKGFTDRGIIIDWGEEAIDAFVFQDADNKFYITWKAYGLTKGRKIEILASELSEDGLSLQGDHFTLTDHEKGWRGAGDEGQCIVKHNGYYYMLYSIGGCCDNRCDYRVMVSRSKNLRSGWEQHESPILQGGKEWRCPGHGTLVTTPDNRYFYLYHSYNATDFEYIGRQGMLDELVWDEQTNWPYFKHGGTPTVQAPVPLEGTRQKRISENVDCFTSDENLKLWGWDLNIPKPQFSAADGMLSITTGFDGISFFGQRPKTGDYLFEAEIKPGAEYAGIGIYSHQKKLLALTVNQSKLILYKIHDGGKEILTTADIGGKKSIFLKFMASEGRYFQFFWSENKTNWKPVLVDGKERVDGSYLSNWGYSPRAGLLIEGKTQSPATFLETRFHFDL